VSISALVKQKNVRIYVNPEEKERVDQRLPMPQEPQIPAYGAVRANTQLYGELDAAQRKVWILNYSYIMKGEVHGE
jgi:hypothetical protein